MNISVRLNTRRNIAAAPAAPRLNIKHVVVLLVICTCTALFYAYASVTALQRSYETSAALEVQRELHEVGRRLRVERNNLRSPARLEAAAQRLGMGVPQGQQLRRLP